MLPTPPSKHKHCSLMSTSGKCRWHWESPRVLLGYYPRLVRSHWPKDPPNQTGGHSTALCTRGLQRRTWHREDALHPRLVSVHSVPDGPMALRLPADLSLAHLQSVVVSQQLGLRDRAILLLPPLPARGSGPRLPGHSGHPQCPLRAGLPCPPPTYWKASGGDIPRAGGAAAAVMGAGLGDHLGGHLLRGHLHWDLDWVKVGQVGSIGRHRWYPLTGM